ncbi:hypothetical protein H5410_029693 [Solanum commersonii]|uniref:Leucine-rich repeat-containing N-terminal plant-type domain-containing protein n=1 Tax=Solanum commersonii TaxID=4109 RepID=A0A9J5YC73_SOLCO|nr:hypothetical protein H5410_029693 [Solanum commersonii]
MHMIAFKVKELEFLIFTNHPRRLKYRYLRSLTYLHLGENSLNGYIPSSLGNLSNLFGMYLNNNQRCGSIPEEIGYLSSLTYLYLANVPQLQLQIHVCVSSKCNQVIHQIKMLLSVPFPKEQFFHQWKNIPYQVERFMPKINIKFTYNIKSYESETINSNDDDVAFASTEEAIALLKWKATFKNQNNSLLASWTPSSNTCEDWYGIVCFNGRVNRLNITNSRVIGNLHAFPFSSLPFLENLNLSMNNFSGTIPPEISNLTNLILRIFDNHLNGSIPEEIGYLRSLTKLSLGMNFLTGSIPASLGNLSNLSFLYLYDNHFSSSIPREIGYLRSLTDLHLGNNSLTGSIPASLGNLSNLSGLYLYNNNLSGSIPEEIGHLRSLSILHLSNNSLNGSIPASLGKLKNLSILILFYNHLSGSIPEEIVSALDNQESNSEFLYNFWKAALMGYGSGLCIGLSIIYFMISTGNMKWLARIIEELEHKIIMRRRKKWQSQRNYRRRENHAENKKMLA